MRAQPNHSDDVAQASVSMRGIGHAPLQPAAHLTQLQPLIEHHFRSCFLEQAVRHQGHDQGYQTARQGKLKQQVNYSRFGVWRKGAKYTRLVLRLVSGQNFHHDITSIRQLGIVHSAIELHNHATACSIA